MKRVKIKGILCIFLLLSLLVSAASAAVPDENPIQPYYIRILHLNPSLTISSAGYADCHGQVDLDQTSDSATLTMELQRSNNGSDWETIKDWTASGKVTVVLDKGRYVTSGYTYRIHLTVQVYTSSGRLVESVTDNSFTVKY